MSLDPTVAAAIIAAAVALLTNVLTGVIAFFTPIGSYLIAKLELRDKLRIEYEYEQRKKLRDLIGRYHGRVLQAAEDMNYRIFNLYSNECHGWLEVDTDYEKVGSTRQKYYFQTTVYRFLNLMFIVRRFEEESLYVDSRIAETTDFAFLKYLRAILWVMTDVRLFDGLTYDQHRSTDHLFKDALRRACDYCWIREDGDQNRFLLLDELREMMGKQDALESVLNFFNGLRRGEEGRYRWDRIVALHLLLLAFIKDFGHEFQRPTREDINGVASKFETREVPTNLLGWLPKLALDGQGAMSEVKKALETATREQPTERNHTREDITHETPQP